MSKKTKQNRPRLKTLIFLCVIIAIIVFSIVVGIKLHNNNNANGNTANISYQI